MALKIPKQSAQDWANHSVTLIGIVAAVLGYFWLQSQKKKQAEAARLEAEAAEKERMIREDPVGAVAAGLITSVQNR